jgi:ribose 5-phosphate isomerase A
MNQDSVLRAVAEQALALVEDGARVGLGTGRAATAFIALLGARVQQGLRISGVPTSDASERQARELHIPLIELTEDVVLDLTVDGADEVAPNLDLIKGWGGALVRERIVAAASLRQVILVGEEKLVQTLGQRGRIPVEVVPLARGPATRALHHMGLVPTLRVDTASRQPSLTDNRNLTIDCALPSPLHDGAAARNLETALLSIAGVVDTGMFLGTADRVFVGHANGRVETLTRST